jgi:regulatory protein
MAPAEAAARGGAGLCPQAAAGPFSRHGLPDMAAREKQMAAMLRAGHALSAARALAEAQDAESAQAWVAEASGEDAGEGD